MSNATNFSRLFREFQYFSSDDSPDTWSLYPNSVGALVGRNYLVSTYGHKIAIVDFAGTTATPTKTLYVVAALKDSEGAALIESLRELAVDGPPSGKTMAQSIAAVIANDGDPIAAYSASTDLTKSTFYTKALADNPDLDSSAGNMQTWISSLAEASKSILANKGSTDASSAALFSEDPRVWLYNGGALETTGTDLNESIILTNLDVGLGGIIEIDGGAGSDTLAVSDSVAMFQGGLKANLSDDDFVAEGLVDIVANSAYFLTGTAADYEIADMDLIGIENLAGTRFDDWLVGDGGRNFFEPGLGKDVVVGSVDNLNHGGLADKDRVAYFDLAAPIRATVGTKTSAELDLQGFGEPVTMPFISVVKGSATDKLFNISYVAGTQGADTFTGLAYNSSTNPYTSEFIGMGGADTITGNGNVRVSHIFDPSGIYANLSATAIKTDSRTVYLGQTEFTPGNSANGILVAAGKILDGFGQLDTVTNLHAIRGSCYSDVIVMGSRNEVVTAECGDDKISGGRGTDTIWGNGGADWIEGGNGVDIMVGDTWVHVEDRIGAWDTFSFASVTDASGTGSIRTDNNGFKKVGDIILDFDDDGFSFDRIDLSKIDANTKARGNNAFIFEEGGPFTRAAGQLIVTNETLTLQNTDRQGVGYHQFASDFSKASSSQANFTQTGALIQGDIQGDGKADFSIFLVGVDASDLESYHFIL
jgi:hypothetical protein